MTPPAGARILPRMRFGRRPPRLIESLTVVGDSLIVRGGPAIRDLLADDLRIDYPPGTGIAGLPRSSLLLPAIWLMAPLAWAFDRDAVLEGADAGVAAALPKMREHLRRIHPGLRWAGEVTVADPVPVPAPRPPVADVAVCYSGGVDALGATLALAAEHPADRILLYTVLFDDQRGPAGRAELLSAGTAAFAEARGMRHALVPANCRTFITRDARRSLKPAILDWWPAVAHGMGLAGIAAPILHAMGIPALHIGSTFAEGMDVSWGSTATGDRLVAIPPSGVVHDQSDPDRWSKVRRIVADGAIHGPTYLRVCYKRDAATDVNCGDCEKCFRTVVALVLAGADPVAYGFPGADRLLALGPAGWEAFIASTRGSHPGHHFPPMVRYARTLDPERLTPPVAALVRWLVTIPDDPASDPRFRRERRRDRDARG